MAKFIEDFKAFALKGNVVDMAVGVIIGGAFGKIVSSVVNDIIMPPIAWAIGDSNFADLKVVLKPGIPEELDAKGEVVKEAVEAITWNYGAFIQNCIDFLIIALVIFLMVKGITKLSEMKKKNKEEEPAPAPEPSAEEKLLTEIRDILKDKK